MLNKIRPGNWHAAGHAMDLSSKVSRIGPGGVVAAEAGTIVIVDSARCVCKRRMAKLVEAVWAPSRQRGTVGE